MAVPAAGNCEAQEESISATNVASTASRCYYHDDHEEDESTFLFNLPHPTIIQRFLAALGMRRRKGGAGYEAASSDDEPVSEMKKSPLSLSRRRCRRSRVASFCGRAVIGLPVLVLVVFGLIHVMETVVGRARLFWDYDVHETFLPEWDTPGHMGEGLASYPTDATRDVLPIPCHSHNDYWRRVPLFDALHWGCTGVEADVWHFEDELFVGHNLASLTRNRTFRSLYVDPLVKLLDSMNPSTGFAETTGHGVFDVDSAQALVLLVDFKTDGHLTFPVVSQQLESLREKGYLSFWDGNKVNSRAVTVVGTGNTPFDMVASNTTYRDIFFDAPLADMWEKLPKNLPTISDPQVEDNASNTLPSAGSKFVSKHTKSGRKSFTSSDAFNTSTSYYASTSFARTVGHVWRGHLSPRQMNIIRGQIRGAKRRGLKVRYWDTPAWPVSLRNHVWHVLVKEGVDMLNVDDLRAAAMEDWKKRTHEWW